MISLRLGKLSLALMINERSDSYQGLHSDIYHACPGIAPKYLQKINGYWYMVDPIKQEYDQLGGLRCPACYRDLI